MSHQNGIADHGQKKDKPHDPPPSIGGMGDGITSPNTDSIFWA
jgi:hypothetical protein